MQVSDSSKFLENCRATKIGTKEKISKEKKINSTAHRFSAINGNKELMEGVCINALCNFFYTRC